MGLRLVAHYLEPVEALIAHSAVDAAGVPCFLHGFYLASIQPDYTMAVGGYRLVVCENDLADALAVLVDARDNPLRGGEPYASHADLLDRVLSLVFGWLSGGAAMPLRRGSWNGAPAA